MIKKALRKRKIEIISIFLSIIVHLFVLIFIVYLGFQLDEDKVFFVALKDLVPDAGKATEIKLVSKDILNLHSPGIAELKPKFSTGGGLFFDPMGRASREKGKEGTEVVGLEKVDSFPQDFKEGDGDKSEKEIVKNIIPEKKEVNLFEEPKKEGTVKADLGAKPLEKDIKRPEIEKKDGSPPKLAKTGPEEIKKKSLLSLTKCFFDSPGGNSCLIRKGTKKLPELEELKYFCYEKQINDAVTRSWRMKFKNRFIRWVSSNRDFLSKFGLRETKFYFMIERNGNLKDIELAGTSGSSEVDEIMLECIRKTSFPPIPKHFNMDTYVPAGCTTILH